MARPDRTRLVVLFGGQSAEHEVSCVSAYHVLRAVDPDRYAVEAIGITRDGQWVRADEAAAALTAGARVLPSGAQQLEADGPATDPLPTGLPRSDEDLPVVVLPIVHGTRGEDGTVQGMLELAGVPFVGSGVLGSALCMDKLKAKDVLAAHDVPQVAWVGLRDTELEGAAETVEAAGLRYPVFVKPANLGSSVGITRAADAAQLATACATAAEYDEWIVVEQGVTAREIEGAGLRLFGQRRQVNLAALVLVKTQLAALAADRRHLALLGRRQVADVDHALIPRLGQVDARHLALLRQPQKVDCR